MTIHHPSNTLDAVLLRKKIENSVYLLGGTEVLRLGGDGEKKEIIDLNGLIPTEIRKREDGMVEIGGAATLQDLIESPLIPECIKRAASLCASFEKRNSATVAGNIASRRDDSYLGAVFSVMGVSFHSVTPHGEEEKLVSDYFSTQCRRIIVSFTVDPKKEAWVKRIGNTSSSHATLIAATCDGKYALSVKGSKMAFGDSSDIYKTIDYVSDIAGSAEYKKYLASVVFTLGRE